MVKKKMIEELSKIQGLKFWPPVVMWREDSTVTGATALSHGIVETMTVPVFIPFGEQVWASDDEIEGRFLLEELDVNVLIQLQSRVNFMLGKKD